MSGIPMPGAYREEDAPAELTAGASAHLLNHHLTGDVWPHTVVVEELTRLVEGMGGALARLEHARIELVVEERVGAMVARVGGGVRERDYRADGNHQVLREDRILVGVRFGA